MTDTNLRGDFFPAAVFVLGLYSGKVKSVEAAFKMLFCAMKMVI